MPLLLYFAVAQHESPSLCTNEGLTGIEHLQTKEHQMTFRSFASTLLLSFSLISTAFASGPRYGGGHHTSSHGGSYGVSGSSHKGGHYTSRTGSHSYGHHK